VAAQGAVRAGQRVVPGGAAGLRGVAARGMMAGGRVARVPCGPKALVQRAPLPAPPRATRSLPTLHNSPLEPVCVKMAAQISKKRKVIVDAAVGSPAAPPAPGPGSSSRRSAASSSRRAPLLPRQAADQAAATRSSWRMACSTPS
jgi:hypothetical protein